MCGGRHGSRPWQLNDHPRVCAMSSHTSGSHGAIAALAESGEHLAHFASRTPPLDYVL